MKKYEKNVKRKISKSMHKSKVLGMKHLSRISHTCLKKEFVCTWFNILVPKNKMKFETFFSDIFLRLWCGSHGIATVFGGNFLKGYKN